MLIRQEMADKFTYPLINKCQGQRFRLKSVKIISQKSKSLIKILIKAYLLS